MANHVVMFTDGVADSNRFISEILKARGVDSTERNINSDVDAGAYIRRLCGAAVSPVVYVNGRWMPDPTQEELLDALGLEYTPDELTTRGKTVFDVIVIGLGPAGLAACHGCAIAGLSVLGLDENAPGGHLVNLTEIDEYLGVGFDEPVRGKAVAERFAEHARQAGAVLAQGRASSVRAASALKKLHTSVGDFWSRAIVIATGAEQAPLQVNGVDRFLNRGVRYGTQADGSHYRGKRVAVVGGGSEALHIARLLSSHAKNVTVLCPDDFVEAPASLVKRAEDKGVRVVPGARVAAVKGSDNLDFLFFKEKGVPEEQGLPVEAIVVAVGQTPRLPLPGLERLPQDNGYYAHGEGGKTMAPGVYVAGDCTNIETRTLMSVVASGSLCAKRLWQWITSTPAPLP